MSLHEETMLILQDMAESPDEMFYDDMIGFIQYQANEKKIEFDHYFRAKWEIEAEHPMTFDESYFEDENRSELYVYLAAENDKEVYSWLEYAWNLTHDEKLTEIILHREIYLLYEKGVTFNSDHQRTFVTNAGKFFDINHISIKEIENGKVEVDFVIEFDNYQTFTAILEKNNAYQKAISFPVPQKYDELYILAQPQLKDKVSEYWDSK